MNVKELREVIAHQCILRDRFRLKKLFRKAEACRFSDETLMSELEDECRRARDFFESRASSIPVLKYPEDLPVCEHREEILEAVKNEQVVIVAGDTGSGKTTQLPKICLEAGRGLYGFIGHTQPRRIAARTVSERISQELEAAPGTAVGYKVRFTDDTGPQSLIKIMTDGILLSELVSDRYLDAYDTIIIDEAHERSLNIDFLLGYLKKLLTKRRDLKLVITSATIDVERFSAHFDNARIIRVSGRTYPVETLYRPPVESEDNPDGDLYTSVLLAIEELSSYDYGDILVFLDGERTIWELSDFLRKQNLRDTEILPLYARLPAAEQNRIFLPHAGRHVILSTNVAETSLTVPGIKFVIDAGTARISRYSPRTKVQRLPVEPVSQASANQRRGRCGRTSEGICIRLYSEDDFNSRPEYTDPEILRTNLASVILQMMTLRLGDLEDFPFIDPPDSRLISDGYRTLEEIGAIKKNQLTPEGRLIARIPADPRLARMLLTASQLGCLREMLVVVSGLSIQDPRERPLSRKDASFQMHQRFADENSDFISYLNLWKYVQELVADESYSQLRKRCRREFLSYTRLREWEDIHKQLSRSCRDLNLKFNQADGDYASVHRSVVSAMISHAGMKSPETSEYIGARGSKFLIAYTSSLHRRGRKWVIAAELTETSRLYARSVAAIEPEWLEEFGGEYLKRSYTEIRWSKKSGAVLADMKISLLGLPVVNARTVQYEHVEPSLCRELFIRHGLVEGELDCQMKFFRDNQRLVERVLEEEDRARRRDILVSDDDLFFFYEKRIPQDVCSWIKFKKWWEKKSRENPDFLNFDMDFLISDRSKIADKNDYPDSMQLDRYKIGLSYHFDPTADDDGVTIRLPLTILNQVRAKDFEFIVPGLRMEFFTEIIRTLPKNLRKLFIPAPTYAKFLYESISPDTRTLWQDIENCLTRVGGTEIRRDDFNLEALPKHLKFNFAVVDGKDHCIGQGRSLDVLKHSLDERMKSNFQEIVKSREDDGSYTDWTFGEIKKSSSTRVNRLEITTYQSLRDEGSSVRIVTCDNQIEQLAMLWRGIRRLIMLSIASPVAYLHARLPNKTKLSLYYHGVGGISDLINDCIGASVDHLMKIHGAPVWNGDDFAVLRDKIRGDINETVAVTAEKVEKVLLIYNEINKQLKGSLDLRTALNYSHVKVQLESYVYKGFVTETGCDRLDDLRRYLTALQKRAEKIKIDPRQDRVRMEMLDALHKEQKDLTLGFSGADSVPPEIREIRWMIEEFKVSLYAQGIGTKYPVSEKRIKQEISRLRDIYRH